MKELIPHSHPIEVKKVDFKDDRLAKATQRITAIYNDAAQYAETKNREIAKILGDVADKKAYEKDGFKSVADYASKIFGIATQNAYALARAGKVYNDKKAHPELQAMSPSKLAELNAVDDKAVAAALESGEINRDTTQKALREFADKAKATKESEKPVVLDTYTARPCVTFVDDKTADTFQQDRTIEEWDDYFMEFVKNAAPGSPIEIAPLKKLETHDSNVKRIAYRRLYMNRTYSIVVEFYKYNPSKKPAKAPEKPGFTVEKFTKEQLLDMLAELEQNGQHTGKQ